MSSLMGGFPQFTPRGVSSLPLPLKLDGLDCTCCCTCSCVLHAALLPHPESLPLKGNQASSLSCRIKESVSLPQSFWTHMACLPSPLQPVCRYTVKSSHTEALEDRIATAADFMDVFGVQVG